MTPLKITLSALTLSLTLGCTPEPESDDPTTATQGAGTLGTDTQGGDSNATETTAVASTSGATGATGATGSAGTTQATGTSGTATTDMPDTSDGGEPLRLATWNVSYLDVLGGSDEAPRTPEDYELLRSYVARLEADVIALQEVRGVAGTQTIFPDREWMAECEDRNSSQNVCVVLRRASGWTLTRNPDFVELNVGNESLRQGLDLTITRPGHASLRILAVHLKSGCFAGEMGTGCTTFFEQVDKLEEWIDARASAGEAYTVLGDFNRVMTADDVAWLELDDSDPANADLTRSIPQGTPTPCWGDLFVEFIDHIALDPTSAGWLQASGQLVYDETDFDEYYLRLSDHCPLWADLTIPESE